MSDTFDLKTSIQSHMEHGDFVLRSGVRSEVYVDVKKLILSKDLIHIVGAIIPILSNINYSAIGCPAVGAVPIIGALLTCIPNKVKGFIVRQTPKDHGLKGSLIGELSSNDRCIVIEDVVTTGYSLLHTIEVAQSFGARVVQAISILDREEGAEREIYSRGIPYISLLKLSEVTP